MSKTICIIGDSISEGVVFSEEKGRYLKIKDSFVNKLSEALGFTADNHSRFGNSVCAAYERMERISGPIAESDYTAVMLGGNDSDFDWPTVAQSPEVKHDSKTPMDLFASEYRKIIEKIRELGSRPIMFGMIPVDGTAYFNWFSKPLDSEALMRFLHSTFNIEHWNEMYNIELMKLAAELDVPFVDLRSAYLKARYFDGLHSIDGIHPSPKGHSVLFEYALPQLKAILRS